MKEHIVAHVDDLQDGEMKQVTAGKTDLLLARINGTYHALYAYCTHYGAPLADGALSNDRVVCPWHHACFHLSTGTQLEPPGRDALPHYDVRIDGNDVVVQVPENGPERCLPRATRHRADADDRTFMVLGGGAAGAYAVEAIRDAGFAGRLYLVTQEPYRPYDRPNCSKSYLQGEAEEDWMILRSAEFYEERDVELMTNREVASVDAFLRTITFVDGTTMTCDGLIMCTGGIPRRLDVPGADLDGVHTLRSYDDSKMLLRLGRKADRVVVIGASFIAMEAACSMRKLDCEVAVVAPEAVPFEQTLGREVGTMIRHRHEENGVRFYLEQNVKAFEGEGAVKTVVLEDDTRLDADLVVVGIGIDPATTIVKGTTRADDGGVIVDDHLHAGNNVYAAGDIACFPYWRTGQPTRIEHWRLACQHGRLAGYNLAGRDLPYRSIPYFWTVHFDVILRYVGHAPSWDEVLFDGDPSDGAFIAYYVKDDAVHAAAGVGRDRDMAALEELMRREHLPSPDELRRGDVDLTARLRTADTHATYA